MSTYRVIESEQDRSALLRFARAHAESVLQGSSGGCIDRPRIEVRCGGAFVTLWKGKLLRGCMGSFESTSDIAAKIATVTESSLRDPRFEADPITLDELPVLTLEISVLSDLMPTDDPLSLRPGEHGIVVRRGARTGCFLPKVATERHWNAEEFLSQCCAMKAGLPADAWRDRATEVFLFSADVFSDAGE